MPPPARSIHAAVQVLQRCGRRARISDLSQSLGIDERTLQRRFTAGVGLRPKQFARIARLQEVLAELRTARYRTLAEIAYACGFADQAHLTREFRDLAGYTPSAWLRQTHEFADQFISEAHSSQTRDDEGASTPVGLR